MRKRRVYGALDANMPDMPDQTETDSARDRAALIGVMLMLVVAVINAVDAVIVRLLAKEVHPFIIALTRTSFGLIAILPWIMSRPTMLRTQYRVMHVLRAALKLGALIAGFFALAAAPLAWPGSVTRGTSRPRPAGDGPGAPWVWR